MRQPSKFNWRPAVWLLGFTFTTIGATALTLYLSMPRSLKTKTPLITPRNFALAPFNLNDAIGICKHKSANKIGDQLLRTYPDWHSSRYENKRAEYLVALHADVGTLHIYDKAYIYCYVDPTDYVVTYFKVLGLKNKPAFSNKTLHELWDAFK